MRILIDRDLCQGHAVCTGEAPEVFDIGADGKVSVKVAHPGPELHERVRRAEQFCPNGTIQVVME